MNCKGCKWKRFNLMSWLSSRHDSRRLFDRCANPAVMKASGDQLGFCSVAWMWPCTDGKLKESK